MVQASIFSQPYPAVTVASRAKARRWRSKIVRKGTASGASEAAAKEMKTPHTPKPWNSRIRSRCSKQQIQNSVRARPRALCHDSSCEAANTDRYRVKRQRCSGKESLTHANQSPESPKQVRKKELSVHCSLALIKQKPGPKG